MLGKVRLDVSPDTLVKDLGVGKQQLVEIAKAVSRNVRLLVLDGAYRGGSTRRIARTFFPFSRSSKATVSPVFSSRTS